MNYVVEQTEKELVIKIPLSEFSPGRTTEEVVKYFEYVALGAKSQMTDAGIREMVKESKGRWWETNKERFRNVPGFEDRF
jgi:hypothetical protein